MNSCCRIIKDHFFLVRQFWRRQWPLFFVSLVVMAPFLLVTTHLGQRAICLTLGRYLEASAVEFSPDHSEIFFEQINFSNEALDVQNATLRWRGPWHWTPKEELSLGEISVENAEIRLKASQEEPRLQDPSLTIKVPSWVGWLPSFHFEKISLEHCRIQGQDSEIQVNHLDFKDFGVTLLAENSPEACPSPFQLIPLEKLNSLAAEPEKDLFLFALTEAQSWIEQITHYKNLAKFYCNTSQWNISAVQGHEEASHYTFCLDHMELAPSHLQYEQCRLETDAYQLESHGNLIFDKINPFQMQCSVYAKTLSSLTLPERLIASITLQGNQHLNSGFKIGGVIGKMIFQNGRTPPMEALISDIHFCFRALSSDQVDLHALTRSLDNQEMLSLLLQGRRTEESLWQLDGLLKSAGPLAVALNFLPYKVLEQGQLQLYPALNFKYRYPNLAKKATGVLSLAGELICTSGEIDVSSMDFSTSGPEEIEEEVILKQGYCEAELLRKMVPEEDRPVQEIKQWCFPAISFEQFKISVVPETKIVYLGMQALLEGEVILSNSLQNLFLAGEIRGSPLTEVNPLGVIPIKLREASLKADGQGIENIHLDVWFDALPNARGKQLPFESYLISCSTNSFKVRARKRGSISLVDLFDMDRATAQTIALNASENLLPFLSIVLLGRLGDLVRGLVPLERAEQQIEELLAQLAARPNVQLMQPCMKELNQLLLQLIIIDWGNWINLWLGVNFPLSGVLEGKNARAIGANNQLQMVLDLFLNHRCGISFEMLPALKAAFSFQWDWNEFF